MSWFIPYHKLDNEQLDFLQNFWSTTSNNYWLKGYAGSGKSILLIYCLLEEKKRNPGAKVIIVLYTHALIDMIKTGIPEEYKDIPVVTYFQFQKMHDHWDLILVDEVQDLPEYIVKDISDKGKRIIVAGDVNQSIYDNRCDTQKIEEFLKVDSFSLKRIHRLSRRIRNIAQFFCVDKNGFNLAAIGRLVEVEPRLIKATDYREESKWLTVVAKEYAQAGYSPAILLPDHELVFQFFQNLLSFENKPIMEYSYKKKNYEAINTYLKDHGLKFQYLGNTFGSFEDVNKNNIVTVMTYHSAKGLDFKVVFIPFLNEEVKIWKDENIAKTLFFVALTRSREQLFLSYNGNKHSYLDKIPEDNFYKLNAIDEINRIDKSFNGIQTEVPYFIF